MRKSLELHKSQWKWNEKTLTEPRERLHLVSSEQQQQSTPRFVEWLASFSPDFFSLVNTVDNGKYFKPIRRSFLTKVAALEFKGDSSERSPHGAKLAIFCISEAVFQSEISSLTAQVINYDSCDKCDWRSHVFGIRQDREQNLIKKCAYLKY